MKLRNLLFATMFACTFASCSNEDDPISTDPIVGEGPATLSVQVQGAALTKGFTSGGVGAEAASANISALTVIVFNFNNDVIETVKTQTSAAGATVTKVATDSDALTAGTKKVLVLANVPEATLEKITKGVKLAAVKTLTVDFATVSTSTDNEVNGKLSMNSGLFEVTLKPGLNVVGRIANETGVAANQIQSPIQLFRNVAIINLASVKTRVSTEVGKPSYVDPQLEVTNVYIAKANAKSTLIGDGAKWGATAVTPPSYLTGYEGTEFGTTLSTYTTSLNGTASTSTTLEPNSAFYTYENTKSDSPTLLILKGNFSYLDAVTGENVTTKDCYYTVKVGAIPASLYDWAVRATGTLSAALYRNFQYNINITAVGPGSKKPGIDPDYSATLETTVVVVPFGQVNQSEEI